MYNWMSQALNAAGKPYIVMGIKVLGVLTILAPLMYIGSVLYEYIGMLAGLALGQIILGYISAYIGKHKLVI